MVEKHSDGYVLKPLKQKLFVDGLSYLLQEIYGIENKNADNCKVWSALLWILVTFTEARLNIF